jgi:hypothetical protein
MQCDKSAFTRVFDALWLRRPGIVATSEFGTAPDQRSGMKNAAPHPGHELLILRSIAQAMRLEG